MNISDPAKAVAPTLDLNVLTVLAGTTRPLSGRQVARLASRGSHRGLQNALDRLAEQGIVSAVDAGRARLFSLNREHLAAPAVEILARLRNELVRRIRDAVSDWAVAPMHASIFGSAARGDGDEASDIDLFIVRPESVPEDDPEWRQQIDRLAAKVLAWTGNHAGLAEVAAADLGGLRDNRPAVVAQLAADAIEIAGEPLRGILPAEW